ncbi:MAG TPA: SLBB domain-containing protein [Candidatus Elarobacter sp.]|jgi:protein involved in polysaccharide export with SLBB domain
MSISSSKRAAVAAVAVLLGALFPPVAAAGGVVRPGDDVYVLVYNHPELSGDRIVSSDGSITMPLCGTFPAAGSAPAIVAARIRDGLRRYLPYVAVDVAVKTEGAAITVAGWPFAIPDGVVKYLPGQTLAGAVASMRGASSSASASPAFDPYRSQIDMRTVTVQRDGVPLGAYDLVALAARGEPGPVLRPGDEIRFVNKPLAVRVAGAVKQPGYAYLASDEPLSDAIDQAGGLTDGAMTAQLSLRRGTATRSVSIADPAFHEPAQSGDAVIVPTAPSVTVGGIVLHPGAVVLKSDVSLLAAVFNAGGPDKNADLGHVKVIRAGHVSTYDVTAVTRGDLAQNPPLADGDQVYVPTGHHVDASAFAAALSALRWTLFH